MRNPIPVIAMLLAVLCLFTACSGTTSLAGVWNASEDGTDSTFLYLNEDGTFSLEQPSWKESGTWTYDKGMSVLSLTTTETVSYGLHEVLAEPYTTDISYVKEESALHYATGFWFYRMPGSK